MLRRHSRHILLIIADLPETELHSEFCFMTTHLIQEKKSQNIARKISEADVPIWKTSLAFWKPYYPSFRSMNCRNCDPHPHGRLSY